MVDVRLKIISPEHSWNIYCNINDTLYDATNKLSKIKTTNYSKSYECFCRRVIGNKLYTQNGKELPLKQPIKRLFNLNQKIVIYT
jgi:hypothetical protein